VEHAVRAVDDGDRRCRVPEAGGEGLAQLAELLLVDLADGEEHDEQAHHDGDHVHVADGPALGVLLLFLLVSAAAAARGAHAACPASSTSSPAGTMLRRR